MSAWLIAFALRHATAVVVAAGLLLAVAGWQLQRLPVDVFPELNAPTVVIMTEAGGLSADEVEQHVTVPIEVAVNGQPGLRSLRSSSALGLSIVWAEFAWGADIWRARQQIAERLATIERSLPPQAHAEISPLTSITGEIMLVSVSAPGGSRTPQELRSFAEFDLTNRLLAVPGIAQVVAIGGELPEYQVLCRQERLRLYGLTVAQVAEAARSSHSTASAGFLSDVGGREVPIRQTAQVSRIEDVSGTVVAWHEGVPVTIGDVAEVVLAPAQARGAAATRGAPAVIISVQKSPGTNTLELTRAIDAALASSALPAGMVADAHVFRQADFIQLSIDTLVTVLIEASIIVAIILILFLLNVRTAVITLTALPISLAVAVIAMAVLGMGLNVMTIGGLAVALGGLVDDAIIDVENVFRRLVGLPPGAAREQRIAAIGQASNEIRSPMIFATIIIVLVFIPLLFLGGLEGRFFQPLGVAYIISTLASLVVALTVTPALCRLLLAGLPGQGAGHDGALVRWILAAYRPTLVWAVRFRKTVVLGAASLAIAALALASTFGSSFLPQFQEGTYNILVMAPPGTSLAESDRMIRGIEQRMADLPGVRQVARRTGRAERDQHAEPPSSSELNVTMEPGTQRTVRIGIDRILAEIPGLTGSVGQPIEHRLSHVLSGTPAAIAITVYGEDLDRLRAVATELGEAVRAVPGTRDVVANREIMIETLPVRYRHVDLARAGLTPGEAAMQVERALAGVTVATINQGLRRYDLTVRLHPDERRTAAAVGDLVLHSPHGPQVRLREVADIGLERASNLIAREGARRKAVVSCNVAEGSNLGDLVAAIRTVADPIVARAGLAVDYGGQFEAQQEAARTMAAIGVVVVLAVFVLLAMALGSVSGALLVLCNLPLALIGGIAAVFISSSPSVLDNLMALAGHGIYVAPVLSIASLVGFITVFGIAVRNGILLVSQYQREIAGGADVQQAVLRGSSDRLVAILMTALTAAIGLIPLALRAGEPGAEILAPLAIVVLGGLLSSTLLNLVVVPAAYVWACPDRPQSPPPPSEVV